MQDFRSEPTFRGYYDETYEFKTDINDTVSDEEDAEVLLQQNDERLVPPWQAQDGRAVDWSPNRARFRNQRKRKVDQEKKKIEVPSVWTLPPAS